MVLVALGWTGCGAGDACVLGDSRCDGAVVEWCAEHGAGINEDYRSTGPEWERQSDCGAANLCRTSKGSKAGSTDAFCVLESETEPACRDVPGGATTSVCAGTTSVDCHDGFAVARRICSSCASGACTGGNDAECSASQSCAAGLSCGPAMSCAMSCACPDGAICDACRPLEDDAPGAGPDGTFVWTCSGGYCEEREN